MDDKILDWVLPAEKFSQDGDPQSMQVAAREILELDKNSAEGLAIMAEAAFFLPLSRSICAGGSSRAASPLKILNSRRSCKLWRA